MPAAPDHVRRDPSIAPLPLDLARAALLVCVHNLGRQAADLPDLEVDAVPPTLEAEDVRLAWLAYGERRAYEWIKLADHLSLVVGSVSLGTAPVLAWCYWSGYRDAAHARNHGGRTPPRVVPCAPTLRDLTDAASELYRIGAIDGWDAFASSASAAFVELTRPTGRATFRKGSSDRG